jgi:hypothetical protein
MHGCWIYQRERDASSCFPHNDHIIHMYSVYMMNHASGPIACVYMNAGSLTLHVYSVLPSVHKLIYGGFQNSSTLYHITTGNSIFAECHMLCRVPNIGHSAKTLFTECHSRQRFTLGKDRFAECQTLGKEIHSVKKFFAECPALGKDLNSAKTYAQTVSPNADPLPSACC